MRSCDGITSNEKKEDGLHGPGFNKIEVMIGTLGGVKEPIVFPPGVNKPSP